MAINAKLPEALVESAKRLGAQANRILVPDWQDRHR